MRVADALRRVLGREEGEERHEGLVLPPSGLRTGGARFKDNAAFVESGRREARRLHEAFGATGATRILDVGCGFGRLPIGLTAELGVPRSYTGVDVNAKAIGWCSRHLSGPGCRFVHLDLENARYNPAGAAIGPGFRFPFTDGSFELIYLYSVFSHMEADDVSAYLRDSDRLLDDHGALFLTAFVEDDVPDVEVNPTDYRGHDWEGQLHCVRFNRGFFEDLAAGAGFRLSRLDHATETDGQSAVYLTR